MLNCHPTEAPNPSQRRPQHSFVLAVVASLCAHWLAAQSIGVPPRLEMTTHILPAPNITFVAAQRLPDIRQGTGNATASGALRSKHAQEAAQVRTPEETPFSFELDDRPARIVAVGELPPLEHHVGPGRAVLVVLVDELGLPESIAVEENTLPEDYLSNVLEVFHNASFSPALIAGKATKSSRRIEVLVEESAQPEAST